MSEIFSKLWRNDYRGSRVRVMYRDLDVLIVVCFNSLIADFYIFTGSCTLWAAEPWYASSVKATNKKCLLVLCLA